MTPIAYRWFYLHGHQRLENIYKIAEGTLTLHGHSQKPHHGMCTHDMTPYEMLVWSRQENVTSTGHY